MLKAIQSDMIPKKLYRGDSDKKGDRILKKSVKEGMLFTNLISGGSGQIIFRKPLIELVKIHTNPGWAKTHFLSFSECENKAREFGAFGFAGEHYPYYVDDDAWNFALLKFQTTILVDCIPKEKGLYECSYIPSLKEFKNRLKVLLIDTVEYLKANSELDIDSQLINAEKDMEWLILPVNAILLNNKFVEYSAKLDMSNLIDYELFEVK
jgi:hypothetical protein